ncbi:MAG: protein-L-isoaspartate(D-aspartate) O-methyltransferase [Myxococcota bacterium]
MRDDRRDERDRMVDAIAQRDVITARVLDAMRAVPRHRFVPAALARSAYADAPLPIGDDQTISQPYVVAWIAELGRVGPGKRVLDVGTGSGYQAAVLAALGAEVYSIERIPALLARARETLVEAGFPQVQLRLGDGRLGWPEAAPFDAILVAAATDQVPPAWLDQLAPEGRLVLPLGTRDHQELVVLERTAWGTTRRTTHGGVAFVPLI